MSNPFDKTKDEAKYMTFDHGFNSRSKEDNPYADLQDDPEAAKLSSIWLQGFNTNKNRTKPSIPKAVKEMAVSNPDDYEFGPVNLNNESSNTIHFKDLPLSQISTEALLAELSKRMKEFEEAVKKFKKVFG